MHRIRGRQEYDRKVVSELGSEQHCLPSSEEEATEETTMSNEGDALAAPKSIRITEAVPKRAEEEADW